MADTVNVGDVWRKHGPMDWARVLYVQLPGYPGYNGGAPGVCVEFSDLRWPKGKAKQVWRRGGFYICPSAEAFENPMRRDYRYRDGEDEETIARLRAEAEAEYKARKAALPA
jgi:hypothetical protein